MKKQFLTLLTSSLICLSALSTLAQTNTYPYPSSGPVTLQSAGYDSNILNIGGHIKFGGGYQKIRFGSDNIYITSPGLGTSNGTDGWLIFASSTSSAANSGNEVMYIKPFEAAMRQNFRMNGTKYLVFGDNSVPQQFIYGDEYYGNTLVFGAGGGQQMFLNTNGLGIGTNLVTNTYKLAVNGSIACKGLKIAIPTNSGGGIFTWPDYVFAKNYKLKSLSEVEAYIEKESHLPDVPTAKEVSENGIEASEMFKIQMQKIEELTLYMIQMQKENAVLKSEIAELKKLTIK